MSRSPALPAARVVALPAGVRGIAIITQGIVPTAIVLSISQLGLHGRGIEVTMHHTRSPKGDLISMEENVSHEASNRHYTSKLRVCGSRAPSHENGKACIMESSTAGVSKHRRFCTERMRDFTTPHHRASRHIERCKHSEPSMKRMII